MSMLRSLLPLACVAALAACNPAAPGGGAPQQTADASAGAAAPAISCDAPAQALALGASMHGEITAAQSYPENARYFCVQVGENAPNLTFELSGMSTDLDLYVGHGSISTVQGNDAQTGGAYQWKSNATTTTPERIEISDPEPGIYYAEVVSFEGQASDFDLVAR